MNATLKNAAPRNGNPAKVTSKIRGLGWLLGAAALVASPGCTSDEGEVGNDLEARSTGLVAFESCDGLLDYFQNEATTDLELGLGFSYGGGFRGEPGIALGEDAQAGAPTAGGDENGAGSSGPGFSTTNVQEAGVDEPDLVKTDGRYLYTVRNGHLLIIEAEGLRTQSDVTLEFEAGQLLLSGNQVLVLGTQYGAASIGGVAIPENHRYQARTVAAIYDVSERATPRLLRTLSVEGSLVAGRLTGRLARLVVQHEPVLDLPPFDWSGVGGGTEPSEPYEPPAVDGGSSGTGGASGGGTGTGGSSGDADAGAPEPTPAPTPAEPAMERAGGAQMAYEDAYAAYIEEVKAAIADTTIDAWIPQAIDVPAEGQGQQRRAVQCGQYYRPGERAGLGSTVVLTIDLDQPEAVLPDPAVVSSAGIVYASGENLYLTTVNWRDFIAPLMARDVAVGAPTGGASSGGSTTGGTTVDVAPADAPAMEGARQAQTADDGAAEPDNREATQIHKLALPVDGAARYLASGRVHGQLLNQFSLSEYQGHLRIAATEHTMEFFGGGGDVAVGIAEDGGDVAVTRPADEDTAEAPPEAGVPMEAAEQAQAQAGGGTAPLRDPRQCVRRRAESGRSDRRRRPERRHLRGALHRGARVRRDLRAQGPALHGRSQHAVGAPHRRSARRARVFDVPAPRRPRPPARRRALRGRERLRDRHAAEPLRRERLRRAGTRLQPAARRRLVRCGVRSQGPDLLRGHAAAPAQRVDRRGRHRRPRDLRRRRDGGHHPPRHHRSHGPGRAARLRARRAQRGHRRRDLLHQQRGSHRQRPRGPQRDRTRGLPGAGRRERPRGRPRHQRGRPGQ
jgi:hypothetical protein